MIGKTVLSVTDDRLIMTIVQHLISPATLPSTTSAVVPPPVTAADTSTAVAVDTVDDAQQSLSVLSYNILLPNSVDGWWTYKMYMPPLPKELQYVSSWEYRKDLLKKRIQLINPDVVCLQEVSPISFKDDFDFMWNELGYDGHELFTKGRFRPVTFWKTTKCQLAKQDGKPNVAVTGIANKDRTLLTAFTLNHQDGEAEDQAQKKNKYWYILNCHLQAGKNGPRRVRQIFEGIKSALTMARKLKDERKPVEENIRLVVCGDFNGGAECGAVRFLEDGYIDETFLEDGETVSSKKKVLPLSKPMIDVTTTVTRESSDQTEPPPTLVVSELISSLIQNDGTEEAYSNPIYNQDMIDRLQRIYNRLATGGDDDQKVMCLQDVEEWLIAINGKLGRGDEYREAAKQMGWKNPNPEEKLSKDEEKAIIELPKDGALTFDGFLNVYKKELLAGKFWGIAYDMSILNDPLPNIGNFEARYDRMYYTDTTIKPIAVLDTISKSPCPNDIEPSDHLPIAASFKEVI